MVFRKASCRDIQEILKIIEEAKVSISELGLINGKMAILTGKF